MVLIGGLYKIMLLLSAMVILLGFFLNAVSNSNKNSSSKMLVIMAFVNITSIFFYLLNLKVIMSPIWSSAIIFVDTIIIVLNLNIAHYVYLAKISDDTKFEKIIINLFGVTFISECILLFLIYFFNCQNNLFQTDNKGFLWIYIPLSLLMLWGTIMPALRSFHFIKSGKIGLVKYSALLILNMINNVSGFYFYVVKFPSKEISTTINMVANIVFAYYFGYFLLSEYFNSKKKLPETHKGDLKVIYTWESFKTHIGNWNEARSYLLQCLPDLVTYIEQHQLSDLEKTHLCLKKLKITSKEVADIMNVSSRSVETQRYRINKKIELNN